MMCQETMQALREGAPNVREELSAMENLTQVDVGSRKRGQGDISGNVEEQPQRPRHDFLAIAQERAQRMIQNNAEDEEAASSTGEGDAAPKRVQVQWRTRFDQLVSCSVIHSCPNTYDQYPLIILLFTHSSGGFQTEIRAYQSATELLSESSLG